MEASLAGLRGLSGLALSAALHALVALVMPRAPAVASAPVAPASAEVSFETLETLEAVMPESAEPPASVEAPAPTIEPPASEPPASTPRRLSRPRTDGMEPAPAPPQDPAPLPATERVAPSAPSTRRMALDPRAVALSGYAPAPSAPPAPRVVDAESAGGASREAAGAALDAHLAQANHVPGERRRPPPRLLRRSDGGFLWRGAGISARILPNGDVRFSDRPGFEYDGENPSASSMPTVSFRFDITDALERSHGNDPYYADRRWFMRQTRQLRQELAARADTERTLHEDRRLLGRLRRIAQDESLTLEARHRAVFRLWRECGDDEPGERTRQQILRFVHDELPAGSAEGFTRREIDALNAGRARRFEPYR